MRRTIFTLIFLTFNFATLYAAPPIIFEEGKGKYPLGLHLDILEDKKGVLTIETVSSSEFEDKWFQSEVKIPNYGYSISAYWVRFTIKNNLEKTHSLVIEHGFPIIENID